MELLNNKVFRYILGIVFCVLYIILGHYAFGRNIDSQITILNSTKTKAEVVDTVSITQEADTDIKDLLLSCKITRGDNKGELVEVSQTVNESSLVKEKQLEKGDVIFIRYNDYTESWYFVSYSRTSTLFFFVALFIIAIIVLCRIQGVRIILSLMFTMLAVFYVFVPAVIGGHSVYLHTLITSCFIIFMTLFLVYGFNKKSMVANISCLIGIIISLVLVIIVQKLLHLSGASIFSDESIVSMYYELGGNINFHSIIYSAMIIGATGAIMDISISIATTLEELCRHTPDISMRTVWTSGIKISRDMIGTMTNTLILAYMGGAIIDVMLMVTTYGSIEGILNSETILIEIMSAVIGSIGLIGVIPITTLLCAKLYIKNNKQELLQNEIE